LFVSATILVNKVEYIISGRLDFGTNVFMLSGFSYDWRGYSRCCILCCFLCCLTVLNYEISVPCVTDYETICGFLLIPGSGRYVG